MHAYLGLQAPTVFLLPSQNCDVYCNLEMPGVESVVLRVGDRITPLAIDPCAAYVCGVSSQKSFTRRAVNIMHVVAAERRSDAS